MSGDVRKSLGCARCGDCCVDIPMEGLEHMITAWREGKYEGRERMTEDVSFMAQHWTEVAGEKDRYSCDQFDAERRECRVQKGKPPVCRDYPWYGNRGFSLAGNLPLRCSYLLDVAPELRPDGARPLIPVEVIR